MRSRRDRDPHRLFPNANNVQARRPNGAKVKVTQEWPPRIEEITEVFGELPDSVVFAWGDTIMVPSGGGLDPWIVEHELCHLDQQESAGGVDAWWDMYLDDPLWRLDQEAEAHIVEYATFCRYESDRNVRARYLNFIAGRLSSKLYGNLISRGEASKLIRNATAIRRGKRG